MNSHQRAHSQMRSRVWSTLQLATHQEISDGTNGPPPHEIAVGYLLRFGCFPDQLQPVGECQPFPPVCCDRVMQRHGSSRRRCTICRSTIVPTYARRLTRTPLGWRVTWSTEGLPIWHDDKGRACITLPSHHPYANSAGYQRLARFLIAEELGYLPRPDEHTHHVNRDLTDDRVDNLELVSVAYHGQLHASAAFVGRGVDGRFVERDPHDPPPVGGLVDWPRDRAVLGNQARLQR